MTTPVPSSSPAPQRPAAESSAGPELRQLGASGLTVSAVGLGTNNLGRPNTVTATLEGSRAVIDAALDAGITFFDTADSYGATPGQSEEILGACLGSRRDEVIIGTKFGMSMRGQDGPDFGARGARWHIIRAVEASLRRLGTDWIDLYQFHTPDPLTPIEETLHALNDLVQSGKVRYIGHSNRAGWQIAEAEFVARELGVERFVSSQSHYNLVDRRAELEVIPAAEAYGLGILPYFPLSNGMLTGKYSRDNYPADGRLTHSKPDILETAPWEQLDAFHDFANERGLTPVQVAFSWLAAQPAVSSVIAGATRPEQVVENAAAIRPLSDDDLTALDMIFPGPKKVALF